MSPLRKNLVKLAIVGFFVIGIVVAAGSFGLFGCQCTEQYQQDPPSRTPHSESPWSTSLGNK